MVFVHDQVGSAYAGLPGKRTANHGLAPLPRNEVDEAPVDRHPEDDQKLEDLVAAQNAEINWKVSTRTDGYGSFAWMVRMCWTSDESPLAIATPSTLARIKQSRDKKLCPKEPSEKSYRTRASAS